MFGESTSESPRQPSPWDSRLLTPTGSKTPVSNATGGTYQHPSLIPEEDLSGHIEYKLRLPAHPSVDRLARLTSQLKWRLLEGGGEAIYELGVCDNGLLLGIGPEEIDASINTLRRMASGLGATVEIARRMRISAEGVRELSPNDDPPIAWPCTVKDKPPIQDRPPPNPAFNAGPRAPPYIHKRRLTKKDRRQVKREREQWLERYISHPSIPLQVQCGSADQRPRDAMYLQASYCAAITPPADDIPGLSHSPSPPSSTTGSQYSVVQHVASAQGTYMHHSNDACSLPGISSREAWLARPRGARTPEKPVPIEVSEAEQAQHALRRHIRKEWKREKQQKKQLERARQAAHSHASGRVKPHHGSPYSATAVHERYLDGLAGLFGDLTTSEVADNHENAHGVLDQSDVASIAITGSQHLDAESTSSGGQAQDSAQLADCSRVPDHVTPSAATNADVSAPNVRDSPLKTDVNRARYAASARRPMPILPKSASLGEKYAVECLIRMPGFLTSAECTDDESSLQTVTTSMQVSSTFSSRQTEEQYEEPGEDEATKRVTHIHIKKEKSSREKSSRPIRERNQLQTFIDFETVWDELEMDL